MVWKCNKCKFKSKNYNVVRRHYKNTHGTRSKTKGEKTTVYIYKPPKGRPGFGKKR